MRNRELLRTVHVAFVVLLAPLALAAPARAAEAASSGATVELFVRKAGSPPVWRFVEKENPRRFDLDRLPLVVVQHGDVQYQAKLEMRGISLAALIDQYRPPAGVDLAILHFANGMAVPIPFRDAAVMSRLDPFIARELVEAGHPVALPQINRRVDSYVDVKPIVFTGNKLAVRARLAQSGEGDAAFTPWSLVDTLVSVELVNGAAYYRQFAVDDSAEALEGLKVFQQACQSCHGVRKLGASFGWDFVQPEPVVARSKFGRLFFHIRYRATSEVLRGAQMPVVDSVSEEAARKLYVWLEGIADKPLKPYAP